MSKFCISAFVHLFQSTLATVLSVLASVEPARAQTVVVRDRAQASGIELSRVLTLQLPAGAPQLDFPNFVARSGGDAYVLVDELGRVPVWVFDSSGRFRFGIGKSDALIDRSIVRAIAFSGSDTLHVLSGGDAVFDQRGRLLRKRKLPQEMTIFRAIGTSSGKLIAQAIVRTPEAFGYPLHVINPDGLIERSFGAGKDEAFDGNPSRVLGALASAGPDRFWTASQRQYVLQQWTITGQLKQIIERRAGWFSPWAVWDGRMDVRRPPPRLHSIWQDSGGRLVVLTAVASDTWGPLASRSVGEEAPAASPSEYIRANDSILEIIDPVRGTVLASQRTPLDLISIVNDSLVAAIRVGSDTRVHVDIWRFRPQPHRR